MRLPSSLFLAAAVGAARAAAAQGATPCPNQGTSVYFGNGINETALDADAIARDDLPGLADEAGLQPSLSFSVAYNQTNGLFSDIIETLTQKAAEDSRFTWFLMNNIVGYLIRGVSVPTGILDGLPGGAAFVATLQQLINQVIADGSAQSTAFYDADVAIHSASYAADLRGGYRVVVVAHSQGNLYANAARSHLTSLVPLLMTSFGVDAVATPAETAVNGYVTSDSDLVIGLLRQLGRTVLAANIHVPLAGDDFLGHGFEEIYINAQLPARAAVVSLLAALGTTLAYPPMVCPPQQPPGAPTLYGARLRYEAHCCDLPISPQNIIGDERYATAGTGIEFPDLSGVRGNLSVIAADIDVLESEIDVSYRQAAFSAGGAFNGYVITFSGANLPTLAGAQFGPSSGVTLGAAASVAIDGNTVLINLPSSSVSVGGRLRVLLNLR